MSLGVDEAVRVDDGDKVEVVGVDEGGDVGVLAVAGDELVGEVLDGHGCDPFASVDRAGEKSEEKFTTQNQFTSTYPCQRMAVFLSLPPLPQM